MENPLQMKENYSWHPVTSTHCLKLLENLTLAPTERVRGGDVTELPDRKQYPGSVSEHFNSERHLRHFLKIFVQMKGSSSWGFRGWSLHKDKIKQTARTVSTRIDRNWPLSSGGHLWCCAMLRSVADYKSMSVSGAEATECATWA